MQIVECVQTPPKGGFFMSHCEVCGRHGAQRHHIMTVGAHKKDAETESNYIFLCAFHHTGPGGVHSLGRWTFAERFGLEARFEQAREAVVQKGRF